MYHTYIHITSDAFLTINTDGHFLKNVSFQKWRKNDNSSFASFPTKRLSVWAKLYNVTGNYGILASISMKNIYTDATWDCRRFPDGDWSKAKCYGINNGMSYPWDLKLTNIDTSANWIWTSNSSDTEVECRKIFSGEK